jgi:polyhydroxybutyrate depolymerase
VDTHREYVMGHSSGAFMAHRLACEHGGRFAAAASFAGAADPDCHPQTPVAFLEIHGTTDPTIAYEGGTAFGGSTPYPSVEATLAYWADANRCHGDREDIGDRELVCDDHDLETHVERYTHCAPGADVELWRMDGQGHLPTFRLPTWGTDVLDFLFAHRR